MLISDKVFFFKSIKYNSKTEENIKQNFQNEIFKLKRCIIFEDANYIVLNKPQGIAVQGGTKINFNIDIALPFLSNGCTTLKLTHRIDKSTSGLLLIAKSKEVARSTTSLFKENKIKKTYWALTVGSPKHKKDIIRYSIHKSYNKGFEKMTIDPEEKKYAETSYRLIEKKNNLSLLELCPKTGRTHQIRAHLLAINIPILGDKKYKLEDKKEITKNIESKNLHLHSKKIQFKLNKKEYTFEASLPESFIQTLKNNKFKMNYE